MRNSRRSSTACWRCRIDWRPSRWLLAGLLLLSLLAAGAVMASALDPLLRPLAAAVASLYGLLLARQAQRAPPCSLLCDTDGRVRLLTGSQSLALGELELEVRGPIVRLQGRDPFGRRHRLVWWPDTLPPASRRQLVLLARATRADIRRPSVAA